jgi:hypothetical protein
MKHITVSLSYGATGNVLQSGEIGRSGSGPVFPLKVLDPEGAVLDKGAVSIDTPAELNVPDAVKLAFVRLTWPSGRSETQRIALDTAVSSQVVFDDSHIAGNEWAAWAVPRLNPHTPLAKGGSDLDLGLDKFSRVWLRLWKFADNAWSLEKLAPTQARRNGAVWQLDLTLEPCSWLLQIGGAQVSWRFLALPGGGPVRVLITPKDSCDPRADALKVVVTSFHADAETLLEFLARDAMGAARAMAESTLLADRLFVDSFPDPILGVAGAYYLLRVGEWQRRPLSWFRNLHETFPGLTDSTIVYCLRLLRAGCHTVAEEQQARALFAQSLKHGWPIFAEGVSLLQEAAALLRSGTTRSQKDRFELVEALGAAKAWAGAVNSFYGRYPDAPTAIKWVGMPALPRHSRDHPTFRTQPWRWHEGSLKLDFSESVLDARRVPFLWRSLTEGEKRLKSEEFLLGNISR